MMRVAAAGMAGAVVLSGLLAINAHSQGAAPAIIKAVQGGGHVLVMRHAASPKTLPTAETAAPGNAKLERQLDPAGQASAKALGESWKTLTVPVGEVWSSPTFRAMETARLAGLAAKAAPELGEGPGSMQPVGQAPGAWLQQKAAAAPAAGRNNIFITHVPNINAAFGQAGAGLADGEALVFHPDGKGAAPLVGRVKIEDWPAAAGR